MKISLLATPTDDESSLIYSFSPLCKVWKKACILIVWEMPKAGDKWSDNQFEKPVLKCVRRRRRRRPHLRSIAINYTLTNTHTIINIYLTSLPFREEKKTHTQTREQVHIFLLEKTHIHLQKKTQTHNMLTNTPNLLSIPRRRIEKTQTHSRTYTHTQPGRWRFGMISVTHRKVGS